MLAISDSNPSGVERGLSRLGLAISDWTERWFPDPFVFALLGVVVVFIGGVLIGEHPMRLAVEGGKGFWSLTTFTLQMVMVIVSGSVVASTPLARRCVKNLAGLPKTPRGAVALVAVFSMLTSLVSWGLSLIFSGLLVRELSTRIKYLDYRAAGAAGYLGLGAVWALGLSSSAALMMATRSAIPDALFAITGVIPLSQTIFFWPSGVMTAALIGISTLVAFLSAPQGKDARPAQFYGLDFSSTTPTSPAHIHTRPIDWLETSRLLPAIVALLLLVYLGQLFWRSPQGILTALDLNTYNLIFLTLGMILHRTPRQFLDAVGEAIPATAGVIVQFPLYGVMYGMMTGTMISGKLAAVFSSWTTHDTYGLLVAVYSAVLGTFIPSGGSKWVLEAPYVMQAATIHRVHLGWVVQIYNAAEAIPNLVNPFWMLPLLGVLKLRARDIVGYGLLQMAIHVPVVFFFCWFFARTIVYVAP